MMLSKFIFIGLLVGHTAALRILVAFPFTSPSHNLLGRAVVRHLLEAKHEVVHITSFPYKKPIENLTEISIEALGTQILKELDDVRVYSVKHLVGKGNTNDRLVMGLFTYDFHRRVLENENVTRFLSDPKENFDVVLLEWFFSSLLAGIPALFNCPFIWMGSTDAHWMTLTLAGEMPNPAYTPDIFSLGPARSLWDRAGSLMTFVKKYFAFKVVFATLEKSTYDSYFPAVAAQRGVTMPSYNDAVYNASMVFANSHPTLGQPHNLPLNVKYIGGYHIDGNLKPMPKHLQNIMDHAKHGVIYFSLGTNLESKFMSEGMIQSLLNMFSKLKQVVIWKFEEDLRNVPANVHLEKWAPQLNILAHPNLKIFITHGGRMSLTEAVYYGVPFVGVPMYGDQFLNMKTSVMKNLGVEVLLTEELADDLLVAIREVLGNSIYKTAAQEMSALYHHRLVSPGKEMVYWVEHTVKSRGAVHLRSPSRYMPLYQKLYLDLLLVVVLTISLFVFIYRLVRNKIVGKLKTS